MQLLAMWGSCIVPVQSFDSANPPKMLRYKSQLHMPRWPSLLLDHHDPQNTHLVVYLVSSFSCARAIYFAIMETGHAPLALHWTFGFSRNIANGVHSLSNGQSSSVFYPSANTGVVYDYVKRSQKLLQGHCNQIACVALSNDKQWLVTADSGQDSLMVVWNTRTGNPTKTMFNAYSLGAISVDVSWDSSYLSVLSAPDEQSASGMSQYISIWELKSSSETPLFTDEVPPDAFQTTVRFHPLDAHVLISNGASQVFFWSWDDGFSCYAPHFSRRDFRQTIGQLTVSAFLPGTSQAVTGTSDGAIILWDHPTGISAPEPQNSKSSYERIAVKIMRLCHQSINHLSTVGAYFVVAGDDGSVRLYDFLFRLEAWFEDIDAGAITSVSFTIPVTPNQTGTRDQSRPSPDLSLAITEKEQLHSSSIQQPRRPPVQEFFVGTRSATIVALDLACFQATDPSNRRGTVLIQGMSDQVHSLAAHPKIPLLLIACNSGALYLWDYDSKHLQTIRVFDVTRLQPCSVAFDPAGRFAVVGFTSGIVKILDAHTLSEIGASFKVTKDAISALTFSQDSQWLALADSSHTVALWRFANTDSNDTNTREFPPTSRHKEPLRDQSWIYIGRYRSHVKEITGLEFGSRGNDTITLVSTSADRTLLEYDLSISSVENGLCLQSPPCLLEETARPTACLWHPNLRGDFEDRIITCNTDLKLRQWNANNKQCRCTSLGPTYGGPIVKLSGLMQARNRDIGNVQYAPSDFLAYSTVSNVAGLIKLPLDGNPNKTIGIIAHPNRVSYLETSADGRFIFTCGSIDQVVNVWDVQTNVINTAEILGGTGCEPYINLLNGGKSGDFYGNLVDYFYYSQLRTLGENMTRSRCLSAHVPLAEIPNLMRALGFYPSEIEITRMISEIKYSRFRASGELQYEIAIEDFIRLYINHRPVDIARTDRDLIAPGFQDLVRLSAGLGKDSIDLSWQTFEKILCGHGEKFSASELQSCLRSLVGNESPRNKVFGASEFEEQVLGLM
ncbi:hypothetical protein AURANDRAFT_55327 [Aureococcus anophagefferens]|uniref:Cilia- and flagella-associated protein 251 n=1 Tax=Aureococcus anophagefferens TaxID=44056 RepID=F0YL49_AURAN|nr:hypothetical protein AURANDRAFT_55327 [Aureococcus anophagefferens]EGB04140.1 hypothetical protein AURANDRAFT_55327 [Aureococcus anophagefferens]|eukprot:XP_009041126.1 hypothetical protein AURANDRAFT_55327 [Aureococcus anophagefferens]